MGGNNMKEFAVTTREVHYAQYVIKAKSLKEAKRLVDDGDFGDPVLNEYLYTLDNSITVEERHKPIIKEKTP
jgi:hypothetical protein